MKILVSSLVDLQKSAHNSRLHQFLKYLSKKHEITVISVNDWWKAKWDSKSDDYLEDLTDLFEHIDYFYLSNKKISPFLQEIISALKPNDIKNFLKNHEYDIHFSYNSMISGNNVARYSESLGVSTVYDIADDLPEMARTSPQIPKIIRPLSGFAGKLMLDSNIRYATKITYTTESLLNTYKLPKNKSVLIPNGVDVELFKNYPSEKFRNYLGLENCFVIGHVGVLREWLDFGPLFKAINILSQSHKIKLLMIGGGVGYDETLQLAKSYGILNDSIFTGTVPYSKVPYYISCMDACVIPFKLDKVSQNSLPLKLFEYMSCEKPVISSKVNGIANAFGDLVFYASNHEEYIDIFNRLFADMQLGKNRGSEARSLIADSYEWSKISIKLESLFEEMVNAA